MGDTAESLLTFENAALPLCVMCTQGRVIMANRAMRALLGYAFNEISGKRIDELVVAERAVLAAGWEERITSRQRVTPERRMRLRCADGSEVAVRASSVIVTDSQGSTRYVVARAVPERP